MQPERFPPDDPREWLNRARSNLAHAKVAHPDVYLEDLCFNAQQAAEKAIKALLLHRSIRFPYVHDLAELLGLLEQSGEALPPRVRDADALTDYAVEARYPGLGEPIGREEYEEAVAIAEEVVRWVEERLRKLQSEADDGPNRQ
ncbi:MAG TPA: HEPN domain-containing protein [Candidatus Bathyarchaeia archaeon]